MQINNELNKLQEQDIYSLMLFCLYKLQNIKEYASLSELAYLLDKNNFIKLCQYFGGMTIKIPTLDELQNLIQGLLLYQSVNIEKNNFDESLAALSNDKQILSAIKEVYIDLCKVLDNYKFFPRG